MQDKIKKAFDQIQADDRLRDKTMEKIRARAGKKQPRPLYRWSLSLAACMLCLLLGGWVYFTPTAAISLDINPSVELEVNRFDRVVSVTGYNLEGAALADTLDLRFKSCDDAVEKILASDAVSQLLSQDEVMTLTVVGENEDQTQRLLTRLEADTEQEENVYCYHADAQAVQQAHDHGLSYGKYRAYSELQALDPSVTPEDVKDMTMCQIRERINGCHEDPAPSGNQGNGSGHHGHSHKNG